MISLSGSSLELNFAASLTGESSSADFLHTVATNEMTKVEPFPGAHSSIVIPPPSACESLCESTRPSPVPPYWRVIVLSPCENGLNSRLFCSSERPGPVSLTQTSIRSAPSICCLSFACTKTPSTAVNLTALPIILIKIWRKRVGSVEIKSGTV